MKGYDCDDELKNTNGGVSNMKCQNRCDLRMKGKDRLKYTKERKRMREEEKRKTEYSWISEEMGIPVVEATRDGLEAKY